MLAEKLQEAAGNGTTSTLYVDDVFSTWLYTGNGSTQTITNGIDLAGQGGLVWIKLRSGAQQHNIYDSARAWDTGGELITNTTDAAQDQSAGYFSTSSTGFGLPTFVYNTNAATYASWTFRKAAKFFDTQTVTHTIGTANTIDLSVLGTVGMVIAKITTTTGAWTVWQRSLTASNNLKLNTTAAQSTTDAWLSVSGTTATLASAAPTGTYVIYAYAHDTSSTGIIQCGSYVGNGLTAGPNITLGWEPQYVLIKNASDVGNWVTSDVMRNWSQTNAALLYANLSNSEATNANTKPIATGFQINDTSSSVNTSGATYIYMAICRPNKPPTSGTQVYNAVENTASGAISNNGFPVDLSILTNRAGNSRYFYDRMRGNVYLTSETANAEASTSTYLKLDNMIGVNNVGWLSSPNIFYGFKRAPGFFDEVCYTGTGVYDNTYHNLQAIPELIITKSRNNIRSWSVDRPNNNGYTGVLNSNMAWYSNWGAGQPFADSTVFRKCDDRTGDTYVAYLFATLAGISKVGSYTGNGSSQNIECGFAAGARFVLIKRTDSTGDWFVWDTARGIVAANDPHLSLNTTAAEVTTDDSVDPYSAGFSVNQVAATNINVSSATYIFLAIA